MGKDKVYFYFSAPFVSSCSIHLISFSVHSVSLWLIVLLSELAVREPLSISEPSEHP